MRVIAPFLLTIGLPFLFAACSDGDGASSGDDLPGCSADVESGAQEGQRPPDVLVRRCKGEKVSLHSLVCGHRLTLLDIGTGVEPDCVQTTDVYATSPDFAKMKAEGLNIIQVFRQDTTGDIPTTVWCEDYVEQHGVVDFEFTMDPLLVTDAIAPSFELPLNLILDSEGRVLERWSVQIPQDKIARLQALLAATPAP